MKIALNDHKTDLEHADLGSVCKMIDPDTHTELFVFITQTDNRTGIKIAVDIATGAFITSQPYTELTIYPNATMLVNETNR